MKNLGLKLSNFVYEVRWALFFGALVGILVVGIINLDKANNSLKALNGLAQQQGRDVESLKSDNQQQTKIIKCFAVLFTQANRTNLRIQDFDNCSLTTNAGQPTSPTPTNISPSPDSSFDEEPAQPSQPSQTPKNLGQSITSGILNVIRGVFK